MKLAKIFVLVVALIGVCEAKSRQKRTLGTILQFFGFKLVPLHGGDSKEMLSDVPVEKYVYQPEIERSPKFMRIQTVMPFRVVEVTANPKFPFAARQIATTQEPTEAPTTLENPSVTFIDIQSTEAPVTETATAATEAAMMPIETSSATAPLKIILEDMEAPSSEQPLAQEIPETSSITDQVPTTEANFVAPQSDNAINQEEFPSRFSFNEQSTDNNFGQHSQFRPHDVNSLTHDHQFHQFPPQFPSFNQPNKNFEIFKSHDLSDSFSGQLQHFGEFQPQFIPQSQFIEPRPFTYSSHLDQSAEPSQIHSFHSPNHGRSHLSTSRTAMNMNGRVFDYMTYH